MIDNAEDKNTSTNKKLIIGVAGLLLLLLVLAIAFYPKKEQGNKQNETQGTGTELNNNKTDQFQTSPTGPMEKVFQPVTLQTPDRQTRINNSKSSFTVTVVVYVVSGIVALIVQKYSAYKPWDWFKNLSMSQSGPIVIILAILPCLVVFWLWRAYYNDRYSLLEKTQIAYQRVFLAQEEQTKNGVQAVSNGMEEYDPYTVRKLMLIINLKEKTKYLKEEEQIKELRDNCINECDALIDIAPSSEEKALIYYYKALALSSKGDDTEAEKAFDASIDTLKPVQGDKAEDDKAKHTRIENLADEKAKKADDLGEAKKYIEAIEWYQYAEWLYEKIGTPEAKKKRAGVMKKIESICVNKNKLARYDMALDTLGFLLDYYKDESKERAEFLFHEAFCQESLGLYEASIESYKESIAIYKSLLNTANEENEDTAKYRNSIINILGNMVNVTCNQVKNYKDTLTLIEEILPLYQKDSHKENKAKILWNKGYLLKCLSNYTEAITPYQESISIYESLPEQGDNKTVVPPELYLEKGVCHFELNDKQKAFKLWEKSIKGYKALEGDGSKEKLIFLYDKMQLICPELAKHKEALLYAKELVLIASSDDKKEDDKKEEVRKHVGRFSANLDNITQEDKNKTDIQEHINTVLGVAEKHLGSEDEVVKNLSALVVANKQDQNE